jgi:hypothetical protein
MLDDILRSMGGHAKLKAMVEKLKKQHSKECPICSGVNSLPIQEQFLELGKVVGQNTNQVFKVHDKVMAKSGSGYKFPTKFKPGIVVQTFYENPYTKDGKDDGDCYSFEDIMVAVYGTDRKVRYFRVDSNKMEPWVEAKEGDKEDCDVDIKFLDAQDLPEEIKQAIKDLLK